MRNPTKARLFSRPGAPGVCLDARTVQSVLLLFVWSLALVAHPAGAAESPKKLKESPELAAGAMQILHANCLSCHNAEKEKGGLQLTTRDAALKGGDNGPAFVPGQPERSAMFKALAPDADPHMPPRKQLTKEQVELVRRWIAGGAPWNEAALARVSTSRPVTLEGVPPSYQPVFALAISPQGDRLAIGRAHRISLHDLTDSNFTETVTIEAHRDVVRALAWAVDGRSLASGSFREVKVWDAESMRAAWVAASNLSGRVTSLRFTPDGKKLAIADSSVAQGGWIRVFERETGNMIGGWEAHADAISEISMSADGTRLASAGADKFVRVWEVASGKQIVQLEHGGAVFGAGFNTNGTEVVAIDADKQLKVWDLKTRERVVGVNGRRHGFVSVAWSGDGKTIVAGADDRRLRAFTDFKRHSGMQSSDTAKEKELLQLPEPAAAVAITADGKRVFAGGHDGVVHVVSSSGKLLARLDPPPAESSASPERVVRRRAGPAKAAVPPSFMRDVLPALAKAGCMAGSCHAKAEGQNGFKLSVFSYDPASDYLEIVKEDRGRRVFPASPAESLILLKPTMTVEHGGGERITPGSDVYDLLVRWIRGGMVYQHTNEPALAGITVEPRNRTYRKGSSQRLRVFANYSDGSKRDVTRLSDYSANDAEIAQVNEEGVVRIGRLSGEGVVVARYMGFVDASHVTVPADRTLPRKQYAALPVNNFIDELAYARFQKLGLFPSDRCSDAEFLRRSSLDAIGILPGVEETRAFLADTNADKRKRWVDRLLAHPAYADHWANKWADLLRPNPDRVGVKSVFTLDQWLRESFRSNKPYDEFAREILLVEGSNHRDGAAVVYRDRREPAELTTTFSQLFLGTRMECAKCHHHPNEKWSQDDFYQFAAFFGPIRQKGVGLSPPISAGNETFYFAPGRSVKHPVTDEVMTPRPPDGPVVNVGTNSDPRVPLADWLTDPANPFFARAAVNRVWAGFFGRGFVNPVDDFRVSNPAVNEPLLEALAKDFAEHGYDFKHLIRTIVSSHLYQLSSIPNEFNHADTRNFSRSYRRRLPAEVLLDAVNDVTGVPDDFSGSPPGTRALQTWTYKAKSQFLDAFGRPNPSSDCPCDRDAQTSVVQSLHMMNSRSLQAKLSHAEGRARKLAASKMTPEEIVTEIYLAAFNRFPTAQELNTAAAAFVGPEATRQQATEDVIWALLNSAEFVFNH